MKSISKIVPFLIFLVFLIILFFNISESELWLSIRGPLLSGLIISLAITIPNMDFSGTRIRIWMIVFVLFIIAYWLARIYLGKPFFP
jgi:hypothetical protein